MLIHNSRQIAAGWVTGLCGALFLMSAWPADLRAQSSAPLKCAAVLTADELTKIIGEKMTDMGPRQRQTGETECSWMLRGGSGGFKTVSVQFYEPGSINASPTASTPDKFFEMLVAAAEGTGTAKREMLPGIGQKAAFVQATPQLTAFVQRADGIARIVGNNLTKAQITAVAAAVAAP